MSDQDVRVEIGATTSNLEAGMRQAGQSVQAGSDKIRNSLSGAGGAATSLSERFKAMLSTVTGASNGTAGALGSAAAATTQHAQRIGGALNGAVSGVQGQLGGLSSAIGFISSKFAALAAIAAGVGAFKEGIEAAKKYTGEAMGLAKALGISATEAGGLNVALKSIGSSSDTITGAMQTLARQLRNNEEGLNKMGLKTRDANGELRNGKDLLLDAVKVLGSYKEGFDRAEAGQVLFGRGAGDVAALLKLNNKVLEEAQEKQKALGLTVTAEGVEAMKAYSKSTRDMGLVMDGLKKTIGDAVMPIFTKFGQWLSSIGPACVTVMKGAIGGLAATFWYVKNGVVVLWETINAMVVTVAEPIRALASAIYKAMHGDWAGAKAEMSGIGDVVADAWKGAMTEIEKSSEDSYTRVKNLFMDGTDAKATDNSKLKSFVDPGDGKKEKAKDERMKQWEATLLVDKTAYMEQNEMREMSLSDESAYWSNILGTLKKGDSQISAVKKKIAETNFQDEKRIAKQRADLQMEAIDFEQKLELGAVDKDQAASDQRTALLMQTQAEQLQLEEKFENERFAIQQRALQAKLTLLSKDPTTNLVERQKILDSLLLMEQKHALDVSKIQSKQALETKKPYLDLAQSIQGSFKQTISGLLQGTTSFAGAVKGLFRGIVGAFADMAAEMVAKWIMTNLTNRVVQATTGVAQVMSNAAVAGSAAFASTAMIPMIGPELAPAAAAAAYSATAAFAPLASARNGFDIPAGVNPLTQLHEKEMVLPAAQADAVRDMAAGKGGGGGTVNLHVHAVDAKSVERLFRDNGRHIVSALQQQNRNFAVKG